MRARFFGYPTLALVVGVCLSIVPPPSGPVLAGAVGGGASHGAGAGTSDERPNILLILTDDQRRRGTFVSLPAVRRFFVQGGVSFPGAVANTPLCCPARASILTGQYAHNHGVVTNKNGHSLDGDATMTRHLRDAGYRTAYVGRYMNGWTAEDGGPPFFERWALTLRGGHFGPTVNVQGAIRTLRDRRYTNDFIRDVAVRWIRGFEGSPDPWFLTVSTLVPHLPAQPATRYADRRVRRWRGNPATREADLSDKPPFYEAGTGGTALRLRARRARRGQLRMLLAVNDMTDLLVKALSAQGAASKTLVIFTSDNGMMWGEHGLRGKNRPYFHSIEVPLVLRWPGTLEEGVVDRRLVGLVDIAPTALDAAGVPIPEAMDGRSLLGSHARDRTLTEGWAAEGFPRWAATHDDAVHYIEYYDEAGEVVFREYYDLVQDPWELENLLGDGDTGNDPAPHVLAALSTRLALDRRCAGTDGPDACP